MLQMMRHICCNEPGLRDGLYMLHIHESYATCKIKKIKKKLGTGQILFTETEKRPTGPIVREGAPQRQDSIFQT
jgi:hypothetical protein